MSDLFRSWQPSPKGKDAELERLDKELEKARRKLKDSQEQGRQRRTRRLESLDALETRRLTLAEILKRMEKELDEKDVDDYADVLSEVFGNRVIYAHRAIGLEALLCQFMHQMLAKQHQLKVMKRTGKDLQKLYQTNRNQNREEFHSYEALAVHLETMRLSLEAQYDDIFAAQHSVLARLHHVEAGGLMTNYKIIKPVGSRNDKKISSLTISQQQQQQQQQQRKRTTEALPTKAFYRSSDLESDDDHKTAVNDILSGKEVVHNRHSNDKDKDRHGRISGSRRSARDRRREIERQRLAAGRGGSMGREDTSSYEDTDAQSAREKIRALEAKLAGNERYGQGEATRTAHSENTSKSHGSGSSLRHSHHSEDSSDASQLRREKRKQERLAARAQTAQTASS